MTSRLRRVASTLVRLGIAGAVFWFLARTGRVDWRALATLVNRWGTLLVALGLVTLLFALTAWRVCVLLRARHLQLTLRDSMELLMVTNLFTLVLPGGTGDIVRLYYTTRDTPGRRTEVATILLLDRMTGLLALTLFPLIAAPLCLPLIRQSPVLQTLVVLAASVSAGLVVAAAVAMSRRARAMPLVQWFLRNVPLRGYLSLMLDTLQTFRTNLRPLLVATGVSVVAHALGMVVFILLIAAMQGNSGLVAVPFLAALGMMANNVPLTPGGLGVGEAAFESLFRIAGLEGGAEALLGWRLVLLALAPVGLWFYLRGRATARIRASVGLTR
ncbi:MAG: lysylphosphatidylglycerol synthase transmembrane domain-containing protein [Gemmatimonadaceae bacterium]